MKCLFTSYPPFVTFAERRGLCCRFVASVEFFVGFDSPPLGAVSSDKGPDTPPLAAEKASFETVILPD